MENNKAVQKRCIYCGLYFKFDYRVGKGRSAVRTKPVRRSVRKTARGDGLKPTPDILSADIPR